MFWSYRLVNVDYRDYRFVQEVVPIGSTFEANSSYITPDGKSFSRAIRERVRTVERKYKEFFDISEA